MHYTTPFAFISVALASRSAILEAPDDACGYLNGMKKAPFGCLETSEKCAIYYPTSSMAETTNMDATLMPMITPAPQPSIVCCEPSRGDCAVQPTACVDNFGDCTGICPADPMTLKCTTGAHRHCNLAHFESPLSFRDIDALDAGLRPTDAPANGWFCGPAAIPIQHANTSHTKTISMAHVSDASVSPSTTLSVTITLSKPGQGPSPSVTTSPSTTLSVTITLSKPGLDSGPPPRPSPPAAVVSEDIDHKNSTPDSDDCCLDEDVSEPCYYDARRARLQRRQAIGSSRTAASPTAPLEDEVSRGSAVVSTTYIGQTDRLPFVEATRPWNVIIPTAVATSTTTSGQQMWPLTPKGKSRLSLRGAIAIGVTVGGLCISVIACAIRKRRHRQGSSQQQHLQQHDNGSEMNGRPVHDPDKSRRYLGHLKNQTSMADHIVNVSPPQIPPRFGYIRGQPSSAFGGQAGQIYGGQAYGERPSPAFGRHQSGSPESDETPDVEEDIEPRSDESTERVAYENAMGVAVSEGRNLAYDRYNARG